MGLEAGRSEWFVYFLRRSEAMCVFVIYSENFSIYERKLVNDKVKMLSVIHKRANCGLALQPD